MKSFNRLASSFAYILISEFRRDIGLKLAGMVGSFPGLGKVIMWALSISRGKVEDSAALVEIDCMCGVRMSLNVL